MQAKNTDEKTDHQLDLYEACQKKASEPCFRAANIDSASRYATELLIDFYVLEGAELSRDNNLALYLAVIDGHEDIIGHLMRHPKFDPTKGRTTIVKWAREHGRESLAQHIEESFQTHLKARNSDHADSPNQEHCTASVALPQAQHSSSTLSKMMLYFGYSNKKNMPETVTNRPTRRDSRGAMKDCFIQ